MLLTPSGGWEFYILNSNIDFDMSIEPSIYIEDNGERKNTSQFTISGQTTNSGIKIEWCLVKLLYDFKIHPATDKPTPNPINIIFIFLYRPPSIACFIAIGMVAETVFLYFLYFETTFHQEYLIYFLTVLKLQHLLDEIQINQYPFSLNAPYLINYQKLQVLPN